jgi:hypothetical protein
MERILWTRYAKDLKPPDGVTRMFNELSGKYYTWDGEKWVEEEE